MLDHPGEQGGRVRRDARRVREHARIGGRLLVDDEQPRVDGGAVLRIYRAVDRGGEHELAALLQAREGVGPGWIVGREARSGDRDETPAFAQPRQGRGDMAKRRVRHAPIDVRHRREGRVHQNHARRNPGVEMIVDLCRVEAGDGDAREQVIEQRRAGLGQLVQDQRAAGQLGEDGEQSGAGRRLEHPIGGRDGGGGARRDPERDGRRELLERLALLGAASVGGEKIRDLRQHR